LTEVDGGGRTEAEGRKWKERRSGGKIEGSKLKKERRNERRKGKCVGRKGGLGEEAKRERDRERERARERDSGEGEEEIRCQGRKRGCIGEM
jgi:hypothetical protein